MTGPKVPLTHVDAAGEARMVDVGAAVARRQATAAGSACSGRRRWPQ
ncbi:MAG: hypothetical protein R3F59_34935 [Myxococcota bacterium]